MFKKFNLYLAVISILLFVVFVSGCTSSSDTTKDNNPSPAQTVQKEDLNQYLNITNWTWKRGPYNLELTITGEVENIGNKTIGPVYVTAKGYEYKGKENPGSENETYIGNLDPGEKKEFTMILPDFGNYVLNSKKIDIRAYVKE